MYKPKNNQVNSLIFNKINRKLETLFSKIDLLDLKDSEDMEYLDRIEKIKREAIFIMGEVIGLDAQIDPNHRSK